MTLAVELEQSSGIGLTDQLIAETDGFEKPLHLPQICDPVVLAAFVRQAIIRLCTDDTVERDQSLRLWVEQSGDDAFEERLFGHPPDPAEKMADWAKRVFGDLRWGLTLNGAERWTPELAETLVPELMSISERMPPPSTRYELVLFVGDYARTPFGFHRDPINLRALHFHIGPGSKSFYIDPSNQAKLKRFKSMETIAAECIRFDVMPGDGFFIPAHKPHLGSSNGFSMAIAVAIRREFKATLMKAAFSNAATTWLEKFPLPADPSAFWQEEGTWVDISVLPNGDAPLRDHAEKALSEYGLQQRSNAGFTKPPRPLFDLPQTDRIVLKSSFPLYAIRSADRVRLFLRGIVFDIAYDDDLINWLAEAQKGVPVTIDTEPRRVLADLLLRYHVANSA